MTDYRFAELERSCYFPNAAPSERSLEILEQAAGWYGVEVETIGQSLEEMRRRVHINWPDRRVQTCERIHVEPYRP